ncbi:TPA: hypothetical protein L9L16_003981 [Klebsiella quasipneumoniae subsp. quasipneumoniae]|uniref:hypothetical protein n=1 Tax=Klebsiella quasipneumoniae TaxID=1463165 RepID=UPI000651D535|nr:hypothetical protein [Klebsiella quasipneumoniae]KMH51831.1 hypothetical protein SM73_00358 [Klebsiella quasipneumoniae]HBR1318359.1 hypothetical protein [Klebsiella quasipneumoniae subsp. quasipneumoniae]
MAPTLDSSYSKDLSEFPHPGETRVVRFGFLINEASLYKISEIQIIDPEDDICLYVSMERVGANDQKQLSEFILDRADEGATEEQIIKELLRSGLLDDSKNSIAGRIALREYSFVENDTEVECHQVAGVETVRKLRQRGLCHSTYLFLLHWYEHLVCDDTQTIPGAKIWAGPLMRTGDVRIYNAKTQTFEDVLGEYGMGKNTGFLPWNRGLLLDPELSSWLPNKVQVNVHKFIVLVISRCSRAPVGWIDQ